MLKHGEVNSLNVHGLRTLSWCPPHFERVQFEAFVTEKMISSWIYENLSGRFYIGDIDVARTPGGKVIDRNMLVGFEQASEATYFSLYLPQINPSDYF